MDNNANMNGNIPDFVWELNKQCEDEKKLMIPPLTKRRRRLSYKNEIGLYLTRIGEMMCYIDAKQTREGVLLRDLVYRLTRLVNPFGAYTIYQYVNVLVKNGLLSKELIEWNGNKVLLRFTPLGLEYSKLIVKFKDEMEMCFKESEGENI